MSPKRKVNKSKGKGMALKKSGYIRKRAVSLAVMPLKKMGAQRFRDGPKNNTNLYNIIQLSILWRLTMYLPVVLSSSFRHMTEA